MPDIIFKTKGQEFGGWTGAKIQKSLYQMTGTFGLTTTDIYPGSFEKWNFSMGDECQISIDDQILITGYVEDILITYDPIKHNIQIAGRDKTGDLVDCCYASTPRQWTGQKILKVIRALCDPFGIDVDVDASVTSEVNQKTISETFKINEGETVFDSILRLCKKGILPVSYGNGKLILTGTGTEKTHDDLELGKNIKSGSIDQSNRDRFQTYLVKGQGKQQAGFFKSNESIAQPKHEYEDELINRYRPFIILSEGEEKDFKDIAKWECVQRAGMSRTINYEVQGWTQSNGKVWPLNTLAYVKDSFLGINKQMLIASVLFSIDNDLGAMTELTLVHPETFQLPSTNPTLSISSSVDNIFGT